MENYYAILAIAPSSDLPTIEKAYKKAALRLHPDKNPGCDTTAQFQKLGNIYYVLKDERKRATYDAQHRFYFPASWPRPERNNASGAGRGGSEHKNGSGQQGNANGQHNNGNGQHNNGNGGHTSGNGGHSNGNGGHRNGSGVRKESHGSGNGSRDDVHKTFSGFMAAMRAKHGESYKENMLDEFMNEMFGNDKWNAANPHFGF